MLLVFFVIPFISAATVDVNNPSSLSKAIGSAMNRLSTYYAPNWLTTKTDTAISWFQRGMISWVSYLNEY
jgi:hypothetical protein